MIFALEEVEWKDVDDHIAFLEDAKDYIKKKEEHTWDAFNVEVLPKEVKDMVRISVLASSGSFSNIAALSIATFVLADLFGQFRCKLNDAAYSLNAIGLNIYAFVLSLSGKGKDLAYKTLTNVALAKAQTFIQEKKEEEASKRAKAHFISIMKKEDKDFDSSKVTLNDYENLIKPVEDHSGDFNSTRGGYVSDVNQMEFNSIGVRNIFASEFAMTFKSHQDPIPFMDTLLKQYDMGDVKKPSFKGVDAKELPIKEHYTNMLGISSPHMFLTDETIKVKFYPLLKQGLGRRSLYISPSKKELRENRISTRSVKEKTQVMAVNQLKLKELILTTDEALLERVDFVYRSQKSLMFDDEAGELYKNYFNITKEKADLMDLVLPGSLIGLEIGGRAFKMARIAAIWSMSEGRMIINKETLEAAMYFVDYAANHLIRFEQMITMKNYEILVNDYLEGVIGEVLPLDQAIMKGYIEVKQTSLGAIKTFLEPINSKLKGVAIMSYSDIDKSFKFVKTIKNISTGDYSYTVSPIHSSKERETITPISQKEGKTLSTLQILTTVDSTYSPFGTNGLTKFIIIDVKDSNIKMKIIHKYLESYRHIISTQSDKEDSSTFTILLPINEVITKKEYMYVTNSVATELMLKVRGSQANSQANYQSYKESTKLGELKEELLCYDISDIKADYASNKPQGMLSRQQKDLTKPQQKKLATQALSACEELIDTIKVSQNVLLTFADISRDLKLNFVDEDSWIDMLQMVNSLLYEPFEETIIQKYLIEPFKGI